MLKPILLASRTTQCLGRQRAWSFVVATCLSLGCPGVEPTEAGVGGTGATGSSTTSVGGEDHGGAGTPGGTGGASTTGGAGGISAGGAPVTGGFGGGACDLPPDQLMSDPLNCGDCGSVCLEDETVKTALCEEGVCRPVCEPGFLDHVEASNGPDSNCETAGWRVFVTGAQIGAPMSLSDADGKCQMAAMSGQLGGNWKAWLSESNTSVTERLFNSDVPYYRLDQLEVASSWDHLVDTGNGVPLFNPINVTQAGLVLPPDNFDPVWTGTTPSGAQSLADCDSWTLPDPSGTATAGHAHSTEPGWTALNMKYACNQQARLYCFEQ